MLKYNCTYSCCEENWKLVLVILDLFTCKSVCCSTEFSFFCWYAQFDCYSLDLLKKLLNLPFSSSSLYIPLLLIIMYSATSFLSQILNILFQFLSPLPAIVATYWYDLLICLFQFHPWISRFIPKKWMENSSAAFGLDLFKLQVTTLEVRLAWIKHSTGK